MLEVNKIQEAIHKLKIYKRFCFAILDGTMSVEQLERIAEKTWEIEKLFKIIR